MSTFADYIEKERARLSKLIEDYNAQIAELNTKLADVEKEMQAIDAYEQVKQGKVPTLTPTAPRATREPSTRAARGEWREQILDQLAVHRQMTRGELIRELRIKGDKRREQSLSNALANMKKAGILVVVGDNQYASSGLVP